jgi:hypothetical protein
MHASSLVSGSYRGTSGDDGPRGTSGGDGGPGGASVGWGPGRCERLEARAVVVAPHARTTVMPPLTVGRATTVSGGGGHAIKYFM